jgi:hypothetical protein
MYCEECNGENNCNNINDHILCYDCIYKYMLIKCPTNYCNNIISLNGYDGEFDVDLQTCFKCNAVHCDICIKKSKNNNICIDCLTSLNE